MILKAYVFPKLKTVKDMVRQKFKELRFRAPFDSQHVKASKSIIKYASQHFYLFFYHFEPN